MTLQDFFLKHPKAAIAFSGGVDSAFLLYAAVKSGGDYTAYFVKTPFQPEFELHDAESIVKTLGARLKVINHDHLSDGLIAANTEERCYHCKRTLFGLLGSVAENDGYSVIFDGTNASDDPGDRPGMRALQELSVLSPLRLCGITKDEIRKLSKEAGLFTYSKPSYSCLATRIPTGTVITRDDLQKVEDAEGKLFGLGFSDFRVRLFSGCARIQLTENDFPRAMDKRAEIFDALSGYFDGVMLDLKSR